MKETSFYTYLLNRPLSKGVAQQAERHVKEFEEWCSSRNLTDPQRLNYRELLEYVQYLKDQKYTIHTVNVKVNSISKYYNYLTEQGIREDNPAKSLRIKGTYQTVRKDLLTPEQLQEIYQQFSSRQDFYHPVFRLNHQRNIVILGLIIQQAAHAGELARMEAKDINLNEGTVYMPATGGGNSRTLELHASQIMPLNTYLSTIRPLLGPKADELIPGRAYSIVSWIMNTIKKTHPHVNNALQLRASVIMHWIKLYNIRQVQYMCGHRSISSTEMYKQQDLEELQNQLEKYHPFS